MLAQLARIVSKSKLIGSRPIVKRFLKDYIIPFYIRMIGGKIHTDDYVIFVDSRDRKAVINFFYYLLDGKVDIKKYNEAYEVGMFSSLVANYPEAIVFNIGANYGMYTFAACSLRRQTDSISVKKECGTSSGRPPILQLGNGQEYGHFLCEPDRHIKVFLRDD